MTLPIPTKMNGRSDDFFRIFSTLGTKLKIVFNGVYKGGLEFFNGGSLEGDNSTGINYFAVK